MLRCSNPECESRKEETPMFTINVVVFADSGVAELIHKIKPKHFECVYCQSQAEEVNDA